jgi:two-component system sensor histidine kinase ChvG
MSELQLTGLARLRHDSRSLAVKIAILVVIFIACPLIIYAELRDADAEKNVLILQSVQNQGLLIAKSLAPLIQRSGEASAPDLQKELQRLDTGGVRVKVLLQRASAKRHDSYLYVASLPPLPAAYLAQEHKEIMRQRILDRLGDTCAGYKALNIRYVNPAGETELLSSMTPIHNKAGCWVILTSYPPTGVAGISIGQHYWTKPEVQIAVAIYVIMAVLVFFLFLSIWRSLQRFGTLAQTIRERPGTGGSFTELNKVPELVDVAREFDLMVGTLGKSEKAMQEAAEENAHAFKTPIAVISQSVEPLKRVVSESDPAASRSIDLIERSVNRLDSLVGAARRMDHTMADLINPPRERINLSLLLSRMLDAYQETAHMRRVTLSHDVDPDTHVRAGEDLLETVFENILDNALEYSPEGGTIHAELGREDRYAEVKITDQGPGVDPRNLERIFDRYFSERAATQGAREGCGDNGSGNGHFGIGLWIARRNVEAVGGEVTAANAAKGGLTICVRLPLDR